MTPAPATTGLTALQKRMPHVPPTGSNRLFGIGDTAKTPIQWLHHCGLGVPHKSAHAGVGDAFIMGTAHCAAHLTGPSLRKCLQQASQLGLQIHCSIVHKAGRQVPGCGGTAMYRPGGAIVTM
jgi:hypothetical protein